MMRGSPSTISVSFPNAWRLSWVRARSVAFQTAGVFFGSSIALNCGMRSSMSRCVYQTARLDRAARSTIACR